MIPDNEYCAYLAYRVTSRATPVDNGCLEYRTGQCQHEYGLVSVTRNGIRKSIPAHRALYMAVNKCLDLPRNVFVRHRCDNPCCVNIAHLEAGTPKDNAQDAIARKRRATKYKPHTRVRVASDDTIRAIRAATGPLRAIAVAHGVSESYVSRIRGGKAKVLLQ